jgi:putative ABC transport system permease protein
MVPWNVTEGSVQALNEPGAVAVDRTYFGRLGVSGLGSTAKIRDQQVKVAAVTSGIRSFTTTPFVFSKLDRAHRYTGIPAGKASHFLVRLKPGANLDQVRARIASTLPDVEVLTTAQFRDRSRSFWLFGTGAGAALFGGALLGAIVGTVIVAQTLYSSTKDHLYEFATLRAIGCSKGYIYRVITGQALINAVIGFLIAACIGFGVVAFTANSSLPVVLNATLLVCLFALTIVMCVVSAFASIARVLRIDPVVVMAR